MPASCQLNNHNSVYVLEVIQDRTEKTQSHPVSVNSISHLKINDLPGSTFDKFRIITNNSIGEGSSALIQFCKHYGFVHTQIPVYLDESQDFS